MHSSRQRHNESRDTAADPNRQCNSLCHPLGGWFLLNQVLHRCKEVVEKQQEGSPRRGYVIVENALHVAHGLLCRSNDQGLVQGIPQEQRGQNRQDGEGLFHSARKTISNNARQAIVNTTSYVRSNTIQKRAGSSPLRMAVVPATIAITAGMEIGNSSSGSISSRLRVRTEIAAKNVPLTTSAQVPKTAIRINCQP